MDSAVEFLKKAGVFYIASTDGEQPKVRPFGAVMSYNNKLCLCTKDNKDCFLQMAKNPKVEICAMLGDDWIRITGEVAVEPDANAKAAMLSDCPSLQGIYSADDPHFVILCLKQGSAAVYQGVGKIVAIPLV